MKNKKNKKKINILKVVAFILQIAAIVIMSITKNKIIYTIEMSYVIWSYGYIMTYKKGVKR